MLQVAQLVLIVASQNFCPECLLDVGECALRFIFVFPPTTKPSREKLIDHYLGIKSNDPALDGTYLG